MNKNIPPTTQTTIDAQGKPLGRLASEIAVVLQGKHRPQFERHRITGDIVHVQNITKMIIIGKKRGQKFYYRASTFPGGLKRQSLDELFRDNPAKLLHMVVRKMLPDNKLRSPMLKRLIIK